MNQPEPNFEQDWRNLPNRRAPEALRTKILSRLATRAANEARWEQDLAALPDRSAPAGFRRKVLARLAERMRVPWWQQSWAEWKAPQRLGVGLAMALATVGTSTLDQRLGFWDLGQGAWAWAVAIWQGVSACALRLPASFLLGFGLLMGMMAVSAVLGTVVLYWVWKGEDSYASA